MARNDRQVVLRVPADVVERVEKVRAAVERQGFRVTASEVYRQALDRGLRVLERRAARR